MAKRKTLSNKIRFEVFKRDNFTCQYCGKKAPDVVLNVDHIEPVSKGGTNDIMNLITSCFECNNGKRDRKLSDTTVIDKQRDELEMLNERKQQIELMMQWKKELKNFDNTQAEYLKEYIEDSLLGGITDNGFESIKKWLKKYSLNELVEATDKAVEIYEGKEKEFIFSKIERIAYYTKNPVPNYVKQSRYIIAILRNRGLYYDENYVRRVTKMWEGAGKEFEDLKSAAAYSGTWSAFKEEVIELLRGDYDE